MPSYTASLQARQDEVCFGQFACPLWIIREDCLVARPSCLQGLGGYLQQNLISTASRRRSQGPIARAAEEDPKDSDESRAVYAKLSALSPRLISLVDVLKDGQVS